MLTGSSAMTCELRLGRGTTKAARAVTEARTAHVRFIDGRVMPSLLRGKLPTVHDDRMLFLGPKATLAIAAQVELFLGPKATLAIATQVALFLGPKATSAIATQVELAAWARDVNNRSASSVEELANPA